MTQSFTVRPGFEDHQRDQIAHLFWQAFSGKLGKILHPEEKAVTLIASVVRPEFAISAVGADGALLGLAGFKTAQGAFVDGAFDDLKRVYGALGATWRGVLLQVLERKPEPGLLLMDGIFVEAAARGMGVGSALLDAVQDVAKARGLKGVRLDVIDTNPRAAALYRRKGFVEVGTEDAWPFRKLLGFNSATRMERRGR